MSPATTSVIPITGYVSGNLGRSKKGLTDRVKNDTALEDQDGDGLGREARHGGRVGGDLCHDEALAKVLDQKREEDTGHDNGRRGSLVTKLAQALVAEHELGMGVQVYECCRNDDSGTELLEDEEDGVRLGGHPIDHQDGEVDAEGTGDEDDEDETDTERDVVVAGDLLAASRAAAALALTSTNAVLYTSVEMAILSLRGLALGVVVIGRLGALCYDLHVVSVGCDAEGVGAVRVTASEGGRNGGGGRIDRRSHDLVFGGTPHAEAEDVSGDNGCEVRHLHRDSMEMAI